MKWLATTLVALLALAYALIVLGTPPPAVRPSPLETGPGGISAFREALEAAGYRTAYDQRARPKLDPHDVVVAPILADREFPTALTRFVENGGKALVLGIPDSIQPVLAPAPATAKSGKRANVSPVEPVNLLELTLVKPGSVEHWTDASATIATTGMVGKGTVEFVDVGALATNRFLGRNDNAYLLLDAVAVVARPGDRIVFIAGGYGEDQAVGPIEAVGPWAVGVLWQGLFLLAAFGLARSVRFGLPAPDLMATKGARDLLDAIASHYRRGKRTDAVLRAVAKEHRDATVEHLLRRGKAAEYETRAALIELEERARGRG